MAILLFAVGCGSGAPDVDEPTPRGGEIDVDEHILFPEAVGTLPGEFHVGADGAGRYEIPLTLPPARRGVGPQLAVYYDSSKGDGILGPGFGLSGLSSIERCPPSLAREGENGGVELSEHDRLCLDGQRLIPESAAVSYWTPSITYRLAHDPTVKVIAETPTGASAPSRFRVRRGDGTETIYGGSPDSTPTAPTSPPTAVAWLQARTEDRLGNYYTVTYDTSVSGGAMPNEILEHVPLRIDYTGFEGEEGFQPPQASVEFDYGLRADERMGYRFGFVTSRTKLLRNIRTSWNEKGVREYQLEHVATSPSASVLSRLDRIRECALIPDIGGCKPWTKFMWERPGDLETDWESGAFSPRALDDWNTEYTPEHFGGSLSTPPAMTMVPVDFNGDGTEDLLYSAEPFVDADVWYGRMHVRLGSVDPDLALTEVIDLGWDFPLGSRLTALDADHDGRDDLLGWLGDEIVILRNTETGYEVESTGLPITHDWTAFEEDVPLAAGAMQVLDADGDGTDDIMICSPTEDCTELQFGQGHLCDGTWRYAAGTPTGFAPWDDTGIADRCLLTDWTRSGDFDADTRSELILGPEGGDNRLRVAGLDHGVWTATPTDICRASNAWDCTGLQEVVGNPTVTEFNGDGLADLVFHDTERDTDGIPHHDLRVVYGTGSPTQPLRGLHDVAGSSVDSWWTSFTNLIDHGPLSSGSPWERTPGFPIDLTGDGRVDWVQTVVSRTDQRTSCQEGEPDSSLCSIWGWPQSPMYQFASTGYLLDLPEYMGEWKPEHNVFLESDRTQLLRTQFVVLDANGDGAPDLLQVAENRDDYSQADPPVTLHLNADGRTQHVTRIVNGLGSVTRAEYRPLTDASVYTAASDCTHPVECVQRAQYVVASVDRDNGTHSIAPEATPESDPMVFDTTRYRYEDLRYDHWSRTSAGFTEITENNLRTHRERVTRYDNTTVVGARYYPHVGRPTQILSWSSAEAPQGYGGASSTYQASLTENSYGIGAYEGGRILRPHLATSRSRSFEAQTGAVANVRVPHGSLAAATDSQTTYAYDAWGFRERTTTVAGTHTTDVWTRRQNDATSWLLGFVNDRDATSTTPTGTARRRELTSYDGNGLPQTVTTDPGLSSERVSAVVARDGYGNPIELSTSAVSGDTRTSSIGYDVTGRFAEVFTNTLGHVTTAVHHPALGVTLAAGDADARETLYHYDGFGRTRRVELPTGVSTTVDVRDAPNSKWGLEVETQTPGHGHRIQTFTRRGTLVNSRERGLGGTWNEVAFDLNPRGQVKAAWRPFVHGSAPTNFVEYEYDFLGRVLSIQRSPTEVEHVWYQSGQRFTRDAKGNQRSATLGVRGEVMSVSDPAGGGVTHYAYGPFGQLSSVTDDAGNVTRMVFDGLGRMRQLEDPDRGVTTYVFDEWGQPTQALHASGLSVLSSYDELGRLISRTDEHGTSTFDYDAPNATGQLLGSVSSDGIAVQHAYDGLGRILESITVVDGEDYTLQTQYDSYSRPVQVSAPTGFGWRSNRDTWGNLISVTRLDGRTIFEVRDEDPSGRILREMFGNGVATDRTFDPQTGRLDTLQTSGFVAMPGDVMRSSQTFLDKSYQYDANGNIQRVDDHARSNWETYGYDALDRLVQLTRSDAPTESWAYDTIGNMTSSPEGTMTYGAGSAGPHAMTALGGQAYQYDAVGRLFQAPDWSVQYNSLDLPLEISGADGTTTFRYDADGNRVTKEGPSGSTVYAGHYELRTDSEGAREHVLHVKAGARPVATIIREEVGASFDERTQYLHAGRLGSIEATSDGAGNATVQSYDPFGAIRDEGLSFTFGDSGLTNGYTGHEHDVEGLINMQGRMYAPKLARFLSPDPIMQDIFDPRTLNAYSYVWNNPVNNTDPSGFQTIPQYQGGIPEGLPGFDAVHTFEDENVVVEGNTATDTEPEPTNQPTTEGETTPPPEPEVDTGGDASEGDSAGEHVPPPLLDEHGRGRVRVRFPIRAMETWTAERGLSSNPQLVPSRRQRNLVDVTVTIQYEYDQETGAPIIPEGGIGVVPSSRDPNYQIPVQIRAEIVRFQGQGEPYSEIAVTIRYLDPLRSGGQTTGARVEARALDSGSGVVVGLNHSRSVGLEFDGGSGHHSFIRIPNRAWGRGPSLRPDIDQPVIMRRHDMPGVRVLRFKSITPICVLGCRQ